VLPWPAAGEKAFFCRTRSNEIAYNKHSYYLEKISEDLGFLLGDADRFGQLGEADLPRINLELNQQSVMAD